MTRNECIDGMQRIIDEDRNKILVHVHVGYLIHAVKYLKEQPEIVRCLDCKHSKRMCQPWNDLICEKHGSANAPDWFCADGERDEGR